MGLVLSALTSVVVFLPMNYITGMMGPYMGPIAFFVPMALIASLVIAIVLTPFIAIKLLKHDEKENKLSTFFRRKLDRLTTLYVSLLHKIAYQANFRKKLLGSVFVVFLLSLILPAFGLVHFQMLPKADRDQFYVYVDAPAGTSRDETNELAKMVADVLTSHPEVETVEAFVAGAPIVDFNGLFKGAPSRTEKDQATLRVDLTSTSIRDISSTAIASEVRALFKNELGRKADFVRIMEEPPGPPVAATFEAKLSASDSEVREKLRNELQTLLAETSGVVDGYTSADAPVEEVVYTLSRESLAFGEVSSAEAIDWYLLANAPKLQSEYVAGQSVERKGLYLTLPAAYRDSPAGLETIPLGTQGGDETVLGALFTKEYVPRTDVLYLEQAQAVEYVTAEIEGRSIVYVMIELLRNIIGDGLPSFTVADWNLFGMTLETEDGEVANITWGGEWEMTLENFRDLGIAMVAALFLVYAVLVSQYGSFATPGYILVTVPLGLIGIFSGFLFLDQFFGIYLTATALIGFIALIGIVVNNAIIFLEYVEQALAEGTSYADALIAAGAVRLRPILLTSLTTVLGSLTIASDPVWSGLAWSFVFGLSLSTALTLVVFPAVLLQFKDESSMQRN
jgi:multidrug efflux pump subunit AcrB